MANLAGPDVPPLSSSPSSLASGYPPTTATSSGSQASLTAASSPASSRQQQHQGAAVAATAAATAGGRGSDPSVSSSVQAGPSHLGPSLASSVSSASYDQEDDDDDDDDADGDGGSGRLRLSADRAGGSGQSRHALFFSTSKGREPASSGRAIGGPPPGRSTTLVSREPLPYHARQSVEEKRPLRPGSSLASRQLGSAPPFGHSSTSVASQMPRQSAKSLSGSSTHLGLDDDDYDDATDEVELTAASPGRLTRSNSAAAELQGAFGFGEAGVPYGHLPGRTIQERRRAYWRSAALNLLLIASWYFFSTLISLYNKWMFDKKHYNFAYPLFVTCFHMIVQAVLSSLALCVFQRQLVVKRPNGRRERPSLSDWATKVVPCGVATALDIGLSNLSLKTITLTFYTMCKSSNLAFVLFFAFLFRLEKVRLSLIGIIALITIGVIMMVAAETQFVLVGAVEVLTASAMGGLRWALAQMLLEGRGRNSSMGMAHNPIATIFWLAPVMAVSMALASMVVEDWRVVLASRHFRSWAASVKTLGLVMAPGVLAFCMHLSEFALIQRTSVVTLSVAGIFKEVSTIILASTLFGDELTPINVTGLCITILGIALYNWLKYRLNVNAPLVGAGPGAGAGSQGAVQGGGAGALGDGTASGGRGGAYGGTSSRTRGDYTQLFDRDTEGDADADATLRGHEGTARVGQAPLTPEEAERRRKREEEADMDGWSSAGVQQTGNGWYEQ